MYLVIQKIFDFQSYGIFDAIILYYFYSMLNLDQRHETCGLQTRVQPLVRIFVASIYTIKTLELTVLL